MRSIKPAMCMLLALFLSITVSTSASAVEAPDPDPRPWDTYVSSSGLLRASATEAECAILIDTNTGKVLYEKNADVKKFPASITKIMTALIVLENVDDLTGIVTIGNLGELEKEAAKIGLQAGRWISYEELLYGLLLESGNDAGVALAQNIGGSVAGFSELMNAKCEELGMTSSHFVNPHGLHDNDHYTTARDMATLTREAMKYPQFVKIISTAYHTWSDTNVEFPDGEWKNHNSLILPNNAYAYEFATGGKTGFTTPAQHTLVATAQKDSFPLIAVMLNDTKYGKWTDAITMFMYGYEFYDTINLKELLAEDPIVVDIKGGASGSETLELLMVAEGKSYYTGTKQTIEDIKANPGLFVMETHYDAAYKATDREDALVAPIEKNTLVGTATFSLNGEVVLTCKLYASQTAASILTTPIPTVSLVTPTPDVSAPPEQSLLDSMKYAIYILGGLIALLILITVIIFINRRTKYHNYSVAAKTKKHAPRYTPDINKRRRH